MPVTSICCEPDAEPEHDVKLSELESIDIEG